MRRLTRPLKPETVALNLKIGVPPELADKPDWYIAQFRGGMLPRQIEYARRLFQGTRGSA